MPPHNSELESNMTMQQRLSEYSNKRSNLLRAYCLDNDAYQVPALPITIAVACVIIAILTATIIVLYIKLRRRSASGAIQVPTEGES